MNKGVILGLGLMLALSQSSAQAQEPSGKDLVKRLGCRGCHSLNGKGGDRGPAWDGVGQRLSPEDISKQIASPQGLMPNFAHLNPKEHDALVPYLSGLKEK
jgi:ubiquinol-cytochrome c reductase cytochrome b subunit